MQMSKRIVLVLSLAATLALAPSAAAQEGTAADTIGLDEVTRGQRGYGLSVFAGSEPERFEVEVLGVLRNLSPESSFIMARLSGQDLEETGVISGMSGSPVYLDGRLAGAVAFSWSFSQRAIAGITPIADMRALLDLPPGSPPASTAAGVPDLAALTSGSLSEAAVEEALLDLRASVAGAAESSLQWTTAGFRGAAAGLLERSLGAVDLAGTAPSSAALGSAPAGEGSAARAGGAPLAPGAPVAALLVDGDLRLAAVGTVTDRVGDDVLAMGHAVLGTGPVSLPMAEAEVVTVISSRMSSFKVSNLGQVVGSFVEDRRPGLLGRIGAAAPTIPLTVTVRGESEQLFRMRLAEIPAITPALAATSVLGSIERASYRSGPLGIDLAARFRLANHGELETRFSFDGPSAAIQAATYLLGVTAYLLQNSLEQATIEAIEVEVDQVAQPRNVLLLGAHADASTARPGEVVTVYLELLPYRGEVERRSVEIRLPETLPAGRYYLMIGDGAGINEARQAVEPTVPRTLEQALDFLSRSYSNRQLAVLGLVAAPGLAVGGRSLPQLPGSVRALWEGAPAGSAAPLRLAVRQERVEPFGRPLQGVVRIDLEIEHRPTDSEEEEER